MTTLSKVDITGQWTLVYDTSVDGVFRGSVCPISQGQVAYWIGPTAPTNSTAGVPISGWLGMALSGDAADKLYAKAADGKASIVLDSGIGMADFPPWILSSEKENIGRVQVDVGNTGFFDNREFRYFREMTIPTTESRWTRVTVDGSGDGIILRLQKLTVDAGAIRFRAWRDTSPAGLTFAAPASPTSGVFANNNLPSAPAYTQNTVIENAAQDADPVDGVVAEIIRVRSSGATAQSATVGASVIGERGIAPGVYYLQFENISNSSATCVYDLIFEERTGQG